MARLLLLAVGWRQLIADIGLANAILELLLSFLNDEFLIPCTGIPVDDSLAAHIARREQSVLNSDGGRFYGTDAELLASTESFPSQDMIEITGDARWQTFPGRVVRAVGCEVLREAGASTQKHSRGSG